MGAKAIWHQSTRLCNYASATCLYQSVFWQKKASIQRDIIEKSLSKGYVYGSVSRVEEMNTKKGLFESQE